MSATIGNKLKFTIFGESHGVAIGGIIDGLLPGIKLDMEYINEQMDRRRPGRNDMSTPRKESDKAEILSGLFDGVTTGAPLAFEIRNSDQHSRDYEKTKSLMRPSHADYTGHIKYSGYNDYRGGGHFSGRITAALTFAGAISSMILEQVGITVNAHVLSIGNISDDKFDSQTANKELREKLKTMDLPVLNQAKGNLMRELILETKSKNDSVGGVVECSAIGLPAGIGSPFFDSVESKLAHIMFSVPAIKGIEFGDGFEISKLRGSKANDSMHIDNFAINHKSNHNGGILGGITNAMPLIFRVAVKPTPSIGLTQETIDIQTKTDSQIEIKGRHDPCIVPRVVPVIESAAALVLLDMILDEMPNLIKQSYQL